ncbi:MAG: RHS repeat-associated core domain-containing protein, partial [Chloroflexi bacterium]|nr:RHS repeat-associated core domain-containing protein [Chloroflexota bacterium]
GYTYDANGNLVSRGSQSFTYDWANRLAKVTQGSGTTEYRYDGDGKLAQRIDASGTVDYIGEVYERASAGTVTKRYSLGSMLVASSVGGTRTYLSGDYLRSTVSASNGATVEYAPFGLVRGSSGTLPTNRQFQGQQHEAGVGLYKMGVRWYDPAIGLWTQPDAIVGDQHNPLDLDRYAFVRNNPLRYTDPTGHCVLCIAIGVAAVALTVYSYHETAPVVGAPAPGAEHLVPVADTREQARAIVSVAPEDVFEGNVEAVATGVAFAALARVGGRFLGTATVQIVQRAALRVAQSGWAGTMQMARVAAARGDDVIQGLFLYRRSPERRIAGYEQHHLWPTSLGGPDEGWVVYVREAGHTGEGGIQRRLDDFLHNETGTTGRKDLSNWALKNRERLLEYLRQFYNQEGIPFPY